ncbi:MAG: hypothetical protein ACRC12_01155, partial [Holosporales bacterium]
DLSNVRVQDLRHTQASTTKRYSQLADESLKKATARIEKSKLLTIPPKHFIENVSKKENK